MAAAARPNWVATEVGNAINVEKAVANFCEGQVIPFLHKYRLPNGAVLFTLGTSHHMRLKDFALEHIKALQYFLMKTEFHLVCPEAQHTVEEAQAEVTPATGGKLKKELELVQTIKEMEELERALEGKAAKRYRAMKDSYRSDIYMDAIFCAVALMSGVRAEGLETDQTRADATAQNRANGRGITPNFGAAGEQRTGAARVQGKEREVWQMVKDELLNGRDPADVQERNRQWCEKAKNEYRNGQTVLWVVGCHHMPGIKVLLEEQGGIHEHVFAMGDLKNVPNFDGAS
eukprot:TRINITY_DN1786_c0_g1_i1.p2 TRINITY_DN1786_c0_g1~~TRINITY_DN1786_c0_g1_i1.p2  ORF type:complete len:288 (+),score=66.99 TRINITY_DN1786_c0_g1_i1:85-948(+)